MILVEVLFNDLTKLEKYQFSYFLCSSASFYFSKKCHISIAMVSLVNRLPIVLAVVLYIDIKPLC